MFQQLALKNFRSIHDSTFTLEPLTVLVGANGSGKSNVVRAIEFISTLGMEGLPAALSAQGGARTILPKAVSETELLSTATKLSYRVYLGQPEDFPVHLASPDIEHSLDLRWTANGKHTINREALIFHEPLAIAWQSPNHQGPPPHSRLKFLRTAQEIRVAATPDFDDSNAPAYAKWMGFDFLTPYGLKASSPDDLRQIFVGFSTQFAKGPSTDAGESLLHLRGPSPVRLSSHFQRFIDTLARVRRFDFDLEVLRQEQDVVTDHIPDADGAFVPAALRWLKEDSVAKDSWQRLTDTFLMIAPHVRATSIAELATGREYIEFLEAATRRPVESWNASDGTLRALAILIALETTPDSGVVVIEEPELRLHPWAVQALMKHVRDVVERRSLQVILTTHSQQVLDQVRPSEVLVASRFPGEGTKLRPARELVPGLEDEPANLGRMWVKGLLGGVPGANG